MNTSFIEIMAPYLPFLVFILVLAFNLLLLMKGIDWKSLLIINTIITVFINGLVLVNPKLAGLIEYDFFSIIVRTIFDLVKLFFDQIISSIFGPIRDFISSFGGGGGGGISR